MANKPIKKATKKHPASKAAAAFSAITSPVPITLDGFLDHIKTQAQASENAGEAKGACFVADPHTGQNFCIRTDSKTCTALKGVFVGGPCS